MFDSCQLQLVIKVVHNLSGETSSSVFWENDKEKSLVVRSVGICHFHIVNVPQLTERA